MINTRNEVSSNCNYTNQNTRVENNDLDKKVGTTVEDVLKKISDMEKMIDRNDQILKANIQVLEANNQVLMESNLILSDAMGKVDTARETIRDINELNRNRNRQDRRENDRGLFERIGTGLLTGAQWIARCIPHRFHSHRDHSSDSATNR